MLQYLKNETNRTYTENGASAYATTGSACLDLFATIGALRSADEKEITARFASAYAESPDLAMKILFFARDVRGGRGERNVFRICFRWLAQHMPASVQKNLTLVAEYGRWDDLLCLLGTSCEAEVLELIGTQLTADREAVKQNTEVSLLAKWLPSVNTSNGETVRQAKHIARKLGMTDRDYRKMLSELRRYIHLLENHLREKDYTFDYSKQPSKAMFKYRKAFDRNDGERYEKYLSMVALGEAKMHTGALTPYELIRPLIGWHRPCAEEVRSIDTTWNALEDYTNGENALVVIDGSGSMYDGDPVPAAVALSLGIYYAERNHGHFHNHFITFSEKPQLVEICGADIQEKVRHCMRYNEVANTNIQRVFELILTTAVRNNLPQSEMPSRLYIISDMEFDVCAENREQTNFDYAKRLFKKHGYTLPEVVFWNIQSRNRQQPVTMNEQGVALVSGCTPRLFEMIASGRVSPMEQMLEILQSERYARVAA